MGQAVGDRERGGGRRQREHFFLVTYYLYCWSDQNDGSETESNGMKRWLFFLVIALTGGGGCSAQRRQIHIVLNDGIGGILSLRAEGQPGGDRIYFYGQGLCVKR